jgi:hypothetical protein
MECYFLVYSMGVKPFLSFVSLGRIPLGCCLHQGSVGGAFLWLFCRMTRAVKQEKQDMSQTEN